LDEALTPGHDETAGGILPASLRGASGGVIFVTLPQRLRAERLAATCATRIQDLATGLGGHARTKPVAMLANEVRGLKGAFHRSVSDLIGRAYQESRRIYVYPKPGL